MATGQELLRSARRFEGERYSTAAGRTSQSSGFKDCSGLTTAALVGVGVNVPVAATVSTGQERWAIANGGRYISFEEALWTPGAGLTIGGRSGGWNGFGVKGHIGFSVGDGRNHYGTPRGAYGRSVGQAPFWVHGWQDAFTYPTIDHMGTGTPVLEPQPIIEDVESMWVYKITDAPAGSPTHWAVQHNMVVPIDHVIAAQLGAFVGKGVVISELRNGQHQLLFDQARESRRGQ